MRRCVRVLGVALRARARVDAIKLVVGSLVPGRRIAELCEIGDALIVERVRKRARAWKRREGERGASAC